VKTVESATPVIKEEQDHLDKEDQVDHPEQLVLLDLKVRKDEQDQKDHQEHLVLEENKGDLVLMEPKVQKVRLVQVGMLVK